MRIRSIKPEFWRSDDITALSREDRLLFVGLWSYVDDNGVGVDDYRQIAADLFALEDDQKEIRDYVREGLATLSRALLVVRYEIDDKRYFYISSWDRHQRVDRPNKVRYPRPPDGYIPPTSPEDLKSGNPEGGSRDPRDTFATVSPSGTGEQGNRGTGEPPTAGASAPTAQIIVAEWLDRCRKRPPGGVIGQVSKSIKAMLEEGIDPDDIRRGLAAWLGKGLHPSALPSVVNEVMNAAPIRSRARTKPNADDKIDSWQSLKTSPAPDAVPLYALPAGGDPA